MKVKSFRRICALAMTAALMLCVAGAAQADGPTPTPGAVSYKGNNVFEYSPDAANMTLWNFTNVMPGDELYRTVSIKNGYSRTVEVYMRAEPANPGNAAETEFLSKLAFEVKRGTDTVNGSLTAGNDAWPNGALTAANEKDELYYCDLGKVGTGEAIDLVVKLTVPEGLDNKYQEALGEVRWVIVVVEIPEVTPSHSPEQTNTPRPPYTPYRSYTPYITSTATLEQISLGAPIIEIDGEEIPLGTPYTGDEARISAATVCALVTAAILLIVAIASRKKRGAK